MRNVAVVASAQTPYKRREAERSEVQMVMSVVAEAIERSGIPKAKIGFTCSGSSDYVAGQAFAFVGAVDALGAWPPIAESHVEMDGAWALYEAWVKIQTGMADSALCFGFGRASMGTLPETLIMQLDPYTLAPVTPTCYVDTTAQMERKTEMLACHASQRDWLRAHHGMDEYIDAMKRHSAQRGAESGLADAEAFVQHRGHPFPQSDLLAEVLGARV